MNRWRLWRLTRQFGRPVRPSERADVERCEVLRSQLLHDATAIGDVFEPSTGREDVTSVAAETANASCNPDKALFLYRLVRAMRPTRVVEFGSALGVSGSYIASALKANGVGQLVTIEGSPSRQSVAAASIESVAPGVTTSICGYFQDHLDVLDGADLLFNDGQHYEDPVLAYAEAAHERMARPCALVLDDVVGYSESMASAWDRLSKDRRFAAAALAGSLGLLTIK